MCEWRPKTNTSVVRVGRGEREITPPMGFGSFHQLDDNKVIRRDQIERANVIRTDSTEVTFVVEERLLSGFFDAIEFPPTLGRTKSVVTSGEGANGSDTVATTIELHDCFAAGTEFRLERFPRL